MNTQDRVLIERVVPSNRAELSLLPGLLEQIRPQCQVSDDQFYNLVIALTEAVNNAIVHGNRFDASKEVHYRLTCRDDGIFCVVEDEGEGFDLDELADPTSPENLLIDGGRGIFIIRTLMREVAATRTQDGMRLEFLCPRE